METRLFIIILALAVCALASTVYLIITKRKLGALMHDMSVVADRIVLEAKRGNLNDDGLNNIFAGAVEDAPERIKVCHKCGCVLPVEAFTKGHAVCKECRRKKR